MTLGRAVLAVLLLGLSGCVTYPDISQSRSPCRTEPGGWCDFVREAAAEAYPYAVASTNAYVGDHDVYPVIEPALRRIDRLPISDEDADKGFDYQIFERLEPVRAAIGDQPVIPTGEIRTTERVLAFRGTDFKGLTDIFYGTLRSDQIELALAYFKRERDRPEFSDGVPWVVTGHSLGGALATEVSIQHPDVRAYMFNTSPFYRSDAMINDAQRMVINERGELLRRFDRNSSQQPAANVFTVNCAPQNGRISKHKIRPLADCVTWIAAYESEGALTLVEANEVKKPMVECGEDTKPHPGPGSVQTVPCVHVSRLKDDGE